MALRSLEHSAKSRPSNVGNRGIQPFLTKQNDRKSQCWYFHNLVRILQLQCSFSTTFLWYKLFNFLILLVTQFLLQRYIAQSSSLLVFLAIITLTYVTFYFTSHPWTAIITHTLLNKWGVTISNGKKSWFEMTIVHLYKRIVDPRVHRDSLQSAKWICISQILAKRFRVVFCIVPKVKTPSSRPVFSYNLTFVHRKPYRGHPNTH